MPTRRSTAASTTPGSITGQLSMNDPFLQLLGDGMGSADTNPKARADDEWLRGSWELSSLSKKKNVDDDFR